MEKTGSYFTCLVCDKEFHRWPAQIKNGAVKTCSKACLSKYFSGPHNPFYDRKHTPKTKDKISKSRKGKNMGNQNGKGYRHTDEARKRISEASLSLWQNNREKMLANLPRGLTHPFKKLPEELRHRKHFSPRQRRELKGSECFYCKSTEDLVLDHIIPIFDGGDNDDANCQTLCRACNFWKVYHVDLPRYHSKLSKQGGRY